MGFQQGLSGLNVASRSLDAIGNNVANSGTAGYKAQNTQFADMFAASLSGGGSSQVGIGAMVSQVSQQFSQGNITSTSNPLDVAINGSGFFRVSDNGVVNYTRNGQFQIDKNGYIINSAGDHLQGYQADYSVDPSGTIIQSTPADLVVDPSDISPKTTSAINVGLNLDSRNTPPAAAHATFSISDPLSYNSSTSLTTYDSLGNPHTLTMYFVKTSTAGQWDTYLSMDGTAPANATPATAALNFSTSGALTTAMPASFSVDMDAVATALGKPNDASPTLTFTMDYSKSTQFGNGFGVTSLTQDGFSSGRLSGMSIGVDGVIQGQYSNGQSKKMGQIVLANFNNPNGLQPLGGNRWAETATSGSALIGAPGTGSNGVLQSSAVEEANVDLTSELVDMITQQRAYQANAQTIKTQDSVLQTLVNLR